MPKLNIRHEYTLEVPEDEVLEGIDAVVNTGVSMMENHIRQLMPHIKLRSSWRFDDSLPSGWRETEKPKELPIAQTVILDEEMLDRRGYLKDPLSDSEMAKAMIEVDADQGINFAEDVLQGGYRPRATHPWDQALRIYPLDHPHSLMETSALISNGMLCGRPGRIEDKSAFCALVSGHSGGCKFQAHEDDPDDEITGPSDGMPPPGMLERGE